MTEAMPFLQKYDITFLRPPTLGAGCFAHPLLRRMTYRIVFHPNAERTPDGKPPGVRRLAAQARAISSEAALPPRAPLRLNFTAQQHHFYPNIEQTPDGITHLGFVQ